MVSKNRRVISIRMKVETQSTLASTIAAARGRRAASQKTLPKSGWRAVAGTVDDDELFREAARLGEAWRKAANQRS